MKRKMKDSPRRQLWIGQTEARALAHLRAHFPRGYADEPPIISPGMSLSTASRIFRWIELAGHGSILVKLGAMGPDRSLRTMGLTQQDFLLPFVDAFTGDLLLFFSPVLTPILPALRSRLDARIATKRRNGRPANPHVLLSKLSVGKRRAIQTSYERAVENIEAAYGGCN